MSIHDDPSYKLSKIKSLIENLEETIYEDFRKLKEENECLKKNNEELKNVVDYNKLYKCVIAHVYDGELWWLYSLDGGQSFVTASIAEGNIHKPYIFNFLNRSVAEEFISDRKSKGAYLGLSYKIIPYEEYKRDYLNKDTRCVVKIHKYMDDANTIPQFLATDDEQSLLTKLSGQKIWNYDPQKAFIFADTKAAHTAIDSRIKSGYLYSRDSVTVIPYAEFQEKYLQGQTAEYSKCWDHSG